MENENRTFKGVFVYQDQNRNAKGLSIVFQSCLDKQFKFLLLFFYKDPTSGQTPAECLSETSKFCVMAWREMDAASKLVRNSD